MKRKEGLTLMELLIVISIIAVLATIILLPICDQVWWKAKITICVSNLKQIGAALLMYAEDWNGYAPPYTNDMQAAKFSPDAVNPNLMQAAYAPYLIGQVWFCPLDKKAGQNVSDGINHKFTSYVIPSRYAVSIPINAPPLIVAPYEKPYYFDPKELECAVCMGVRQAKRWMYAYDPHHERLFQFEPIILLLNGRVVTYKGGHGAHECPSKELPKYWPFADWP